MRPVFSCMRMFLWCGTYFAGKRKIKLLFVEKCDKFVRDNRESGLVCMKGIGKSTKTMKVILIVCLIVLAALIALTGWLWYDTQPKFQDATIELGTQNIPIQIFLTDYADADKASFTDKPATDVLGKQSVTLRYGLKAETVTLTVVDTTAPKVEFQNITARVDRVLSPEDFIVAVQDHSKITTSFADQVYLPSVYDDLTVQIKVEDEAGNTTTGDCVVSYIWMPEEITLELGTALTVEDVLIRPVKDADLLNKADLEAISNSPVGSYTITSTYEDKTCSCRVIVRDTTAPALQVQDVLIEQSDKVTVEAFIVSVQDYSDDVTCEFVEEPDFDLLGVQTVTIRATDAYGNSTTAQAALRISGDITPPVLSGLSTITVPKGTKPDYMKGVSASDDKDKNVAITCDDSKVDIQTAGTYYLTYTATDNSGNVTTEKRKVVVEHNQEDTAALVKEIAATLPDDPEKIRDYVRNNIRYSADWGDDDPVWFGFQNRKGNCYVHALSLEALLKEKGYEVQLIWTTDKTHYWHIIKLDGKWKHIDSTPSVPYSHMKYSLMNDTQRLETLNTGGHVRDWDRKLWPACE